MSARLADLAVFLFAVALAGVTLLDEVGPHDEGLVLAAAGRIANGELPYRDLWTNYGPGEFVLLGGLVKVVGPSLLAWRVVRVLVGAVVAVLCLRLARRGGAGPWWSLGAGLAAGSAVAWPLTPGPTVPALVPALGALLVVRADAGAKRVVLAGVLAGVAAWIRPELGIAAALGALLLLPERRGLLLAGAAGSTVVLYAPFVLAAPGDFWDDTVGFLGVQGLQRLPFPLDPPADPNKAFEVLFPVILLVATAAWVVLADARPRALAPLVLAGLAYLLARTDEFHLVPLVAVLAPALAVAGSSRVPSPWSAWPRRLLRAARGGEERGPRARALRVLRALRTRGHAEDRLGGAREAARRRQAPAPRAAPAETSTAVVLGRVRRTFLATLLALLALHGIERQAGRVLHPPALAAVPGGIGDGVRTTAADARALRVLVPRVRALGRPVLVVPPRLDRVRVGNPLLNVILDLPNPTRYDVIQPGVVTTDAVQRELIGDVERTRATVIRWTAPAATRVEDNGAGRERGSRRFDTYLRTAYREEFTVGDYVVLVRR